MTPTAGTGSARRERSGPEDLFEQTRMTFGEHLEELRAALIRALIGLVIGGAIGLTVASGVVRFLTAPLERAIVRFNQARAAERIVQEQGWIGPETQALLDRKEQTPRVVAVDAGQLVAALRSVSPDFLAGVDLQPWRFRPADLDDAGAAEIARRLVDPPAGAAAAWRDLSGLLSEGERTALASAVSGDTGDSGAHSARMAVLDCLNRLVEDRRVPDLPCFAGLFVQPVQGWWSRLVSGAPRPAPLQRMKQALEQENQPDLARRLNRALVTQALEGLVREPGLDLVHLELWEPAAAKPQSLGTTEGFMVWMKAGLIFGAVIAGPWIFIQIWNFVAAGLYPHEKQYVHIYVPISLVLFAAGVAVVFLFVFDPVLDFFLGVNYSLGIDLQPRISEWLGFVLMLPLGFGIAFQLPLVMLLLNRLGVFSVRSYLAQWRIAVMVIFVMSMILTPADPLSMILMAFPLTALYFLGVLLCLWLPGRELPFPESE